MVQSSDIEKLARELLSIAYDTNRELGESGFKRVKADKDLVLEADLEISRRVITRTKESGLSLILFTEEFGKNEINISQNNPANYTLAFDDIDGTFNKYDGRGILPYCSIVTVFDSIAPAHADALYAGIRIHNTGDLIEATRGQGTKLNGNQLAPLRKINNETRLYVSIYETARKNPEILSKLLPLMARTRCPGEILSAGVAFAMVAIHGGAYICAANKEHELGAGYLLMRECGGVALDLDGKDLGPNQYDFDAKLPVIAASSQEIADEILRELKK